MVLVVDGRCCLLSSAKMCQNPFSVFLTLMTSLVCNTAVKRGVFISIITTLSSHTRRTPPSTARMPDAMELEASAEAVSPHLEDVPTAPSDEESAMLLRDTSKVLTENQIKVAIEPSQRRTATYVLVMASFIDLAGAVILLPNHPMMVSNAPEAVRPATWPANYTHPQALPADGMPPYQWAVNLLFVLNFLGQAFSNVLLGTLSDKYGRRPIILLAIGMGCVTLILYYIAGAVVKQYDGPHASSQAGPLADCCSCCYCCCCHHLEMVAEPTCGCTGTGCMQRFSLSTVSSVARRR